MSNIDLKDLKNWENLKKLYDSEDKQSWALADEILDKADADKYDNQIKALIKVIPENKTDLRTSDTWAKIFESEIKKDTEGHQVQLLADIYTEFLTRILFHDGVFHKNFKIKLIYNGRKE